MPSPLLPYLPAAIDRLVKPLHPAIARRLQEAVCAISSHSEPSEAARTAVIIAASSHRVSMYETGAKILSQLAEYDSASLQAVSELARSPDARIRHNAILCLTKDVPARVSAEVIVSALSDTSSRVRRKAADWAGRLGLALALPAIEQALDIEPHYETRVVLAAEVARLRNAS